MGKIFKKCNQKDCINKKKGEDEMCNRVKGALILAGLMFVGGVSALEVDGFERRILKPGDVIFAQSAQAPEIYFRQMIRHVDKDVLNWSRRFNV
jgi:hypothetical protein